MTLYTVVEWVEWEITFFTIFSTKDKAQKYIDKEMTEHDKPKSSFVIEEIEIDSGNSVCS